MASDQQSRVLGFFTTMENQGGVIVRDVPKFDLELYISNYRGRTRFDRLFLIGQCSVPLCIDALKYAVSEAKKGRDIQRYKDAWECLYEASPNEPEAQYDEAWVITTDKSNKALTHQLETELKGYKNNLVKESIRIGHRDLGEHLESIGDLSGAAEAYVKMRPDASTVSHIVDVGKHILSVLVQKRDWTAVLTNANKIMVPSTTTEEGPATEQTFQKVVAGLAYLSSGSYAEAARCFLDAGDPAICQRHNDVINSNDVATYGGLLALATMDREELQHRVLDNSSFRNYLELEPHIRKAVSMFVNCRYSACLQLLESYRSDYLLDLYLQKHVASIFSLIRRKCIVQYIIPYSCVTLDTMREAFGKSGEDLEAELISMIKSGVLNARINTIDKLLVVPQIDPRTRMRMKALAAVARYEKEALERIRRMSIAASDLEVKGTIRKTAASVSGGPPSTVGELVTDEFTNSEDIGTDNTT
ncbi:26S proteasome subunit RPN7-domain-containing protein [Xylaria sp. CBS 124048]|nr:26S proteasome subunit RPN7-domain-containing protein [Xylaria sp. CBS 124048]